MASQLKIEKIKSLTFVEGLHDNPSFEWFKRMANGQYVSQGTYNFKASISSFNRELEKGGFALSRLLTASVRLYNYTFDPLTGHEVLDEVFPNGYPQPQDKILYTLDGHYYRVSFTKPEGSGAYIRLVADSITKGI